jgi:hypothetical protein
MRRPIAIAGPLSVGFPNHGTILSHERICSLHLTNASLLNGRVFSCFPADCVGIHLAFCHETI